MKLIGMGSLIATLKADATMAMLAQSRPWWKVAINTVLRAVQPQARKLVIYSKFDLTPAGPVLVGYGLGRILHRQEKTARVS